VKIKDMERRRKGKIINGGDPQTVINVNNYFKNPDKIDNYIVNETCNATCTSRASFKRIRKEAAPPPLRTPEKHRKVTYHTDRYVKYDDFVRSAMRRKARSSILQNIPPTLSAVLEKVNDDEQLPNFKRTTFYALMKEIGFNYEKRSKKGAAGRKKRHHNMATFISEEG
jgi:hypothetical protein